MKALKERRERETSQANHWMALSVQYIESMLYCIGRGQWKVAGIDSRCALNHLDTAQRHIAYAAAIAEAELSL